MKELFTFDKNNYDHSLPRHIRESVRGILCYEDQVILVKSRIQGYYKFPGGGCEAGETHFQTLQRETFEETGLMLLPDSLSEFGLVRELRRDLYRRDVFEQISYYYFASVSGEIPVSSVIGSEPESGFSVECTDLHTALNQNRRILSEKGKKSEFLKRETYVLELLLRDSLITGANFIQ